MEEAANSVLLVPPPIQVPALSPAISRLTQSLTELTASHTANNTAISSLADEREVLEERDKQMRKLVENAETKRSWFVIFREWVESVATFLDEKVGSTLSKLILLLTCNSWKVSTP